MRILLTGAGGPAAVGVSRSLSLAGHFLVGVDCDQYTIQFAETHKRYQVPRASDPGYLSAINNIAVLERIDLIHAQPDPEVAALSEAREMLAARTHLPSKQAVRVCQDKMACYGVLRDAAVPVPYSVQLDSANDLDQFFGQAQDGWVRFRTGAAGRGALRVRSFGEALLWIESHDGWGEFMASEYLPGRCVTWQSVWNRGELVCSQSRERIEWALANRSPSGVTGITGVAKTITRADVGTVGRAAVLAVDAVPNGIYGVDMKENASGVPCVTEINIGRFFTTIEFFTQMGLNMPDLYVRSAFGQKTEHEMIDDDWYWIRSMDSLPRLVMGSEFA